MLRNQGKSRSALTLSLVRPSFGANGGFKIESNGGSKMDGMDLKSRDGARGVRARACLMSLLTFCILARQPSQFSATCAIQEIYWFSN